MTKIELSKENFVAVLQYKQQPIYFFRFDVEETENDTYLCSEITISLKNATYDTMVDALIDSKYTIPSQLALLYNYQSDSELYAKQMQEYQNWRTYCKEAARKYFNIEKDNHTIDDNYTEEESGE